MTAAAQLRFERRHRLVFELLEASPRPTAERAAEIMNELHAIDTAVCAE